MRRYLLLASTAAILGCGPTEFEGYTTQATEIVDRATGEPVHLIGFGIGGWLLPEGYMWGLRELDRPRQFEEAIEDLIGPEDAERFWRLYHDNFTTEEDFRAMKVMGANSVRIALLASELLPRDHGSGPEFAFDPGGFAYLDSVVAWGTRHELGVIWDMHGAPGAQNAENISDSDGQARLWTEPDTYWPQLEAIWVEIARRYAGNPWIIGYDLLNEPLLDRYPGIDAADLRTLYVRLTGAIRRVEPNGLIFIEGDDWAQNFSMLEPIDWDPHLVLAFHSYPPTSNAEGLARWDALRKQYQVPLWHGETGEVSAPYVLNRRSTEFLREAGVGWSWWTHKKISRQTQPWHCPPTPGFTRILDYWQGQGPRPSADEAREWLLGQAERMNSRFCVFLPDMVASLDGLDPEAWHSARGHEAPRVFSDLQSVTAPLGGVAVLSVGATGFPLGYTWTRDGIVVAEATGPSVRVVASSPEDAANWQVVVRNELGADTSSIASLAVGPFEGYAIGVQPGEWLPITNRVAGAGYPTPSDLSGRWRLWVGDEGLQGEIEVTDDVLMNSDPRPHHNDGIELYLDLDNGKDLHYADDDAQVRVIRDSDFQADRGRLPAGMVVAQDEREGGYSVAFTVPGDFAPGQLVGIEVHLVDNDRDRREHKLAWWGTRDTAYSRASSFGTARVR